MIFGHCIAFLFSCIGIIDKNTKMSQKQDMDLTGPN